jgi:uncharacterized protein
MPDWLTSIPVSPGVFALLVGVSFLTSAMTAAFGIGGGVAMLGALAGLAPPQMVVAVHGVVQLGSNLGRAVIQRAHVLWRPTGIFTIGAVAGAAAGVILFVALPERVLLGLLGLFILVMVWVPKPKIPGLESTGMLIGGFIATLITMFVGATGSFVQALLVPQGLDRKTLIATHAACMSIHHVLKVLAFGLIGVAFAEWFTLIVAMIVSGLAGTWAGTKLLERLPEAWFHGVLKACLTLVALDLLRRSLTG